MNAANGKTDMLLPTIIMAALAVILLLISYLKGGGQHITSLKISFRLLMSMLPLLIFALVVAGCIQSLLTKEFVAKWVGAESGLRGILLGTVAGGIAPGGPYVSLPVALGLLNSGAGIGTMVAFITGWSLWAISRIPLEVGVLGWRIVGIRLACTFFFPPIAGLLAQRFFSHIKIP